MTDARHILCNARAGIDLPSDGLAAEAFAPRPDGNTKYVVHPSAPFHA